MKLTGPFSARTAALIAILCLTAILYSATWRLRAQAALDRRLHGDEVQTADAIAEIEDTTPPARMEQLLLQYADDPSPVLRHAAIDELANFSDARAVDAEVRAFSDSSADVRYSAVYNVSKLDRRRGLPLLAAGLRDSDTLIRESAAGDVGAFGDRQIVKNLIDALGDPDPTVVHLAAGDLRKITHRPYSMKFMDSESRKRQVVQEWRAWWRAAQGHWAIDPAIANMPPILPARTDPAPDFNVDDLDGRRISLASQKGRITLLNFWGTWCPPCQMEIPDLVRIDHAYRSRGVDVVGIALSEPSAGTLRRWCDAHEIDYPQVMAPGPLLDDYGHIHQVPITVLIDRSGLIRYRWEGPRDYPTFSAAVDRILRE